MELRYYCTKCNGYSHYKGEITKDSPKERMVRCIRCFEITKATLQPKKGRAKTYTKLLEVRHRRS